MLLRKKILIMEKMPPIEKVFEAWTAIADGRVSLNDNHADIASSDGAKSYVVRFDGNKYSSDDNATYWRGYAGYPVIAVLMLQGRLPFVESQAELWRNVNWKEINTRYKNDYSKAVKEVAEERHINVADSYRDAEAVLEALKLLKIEIKRKI